MYVLCFIVWYAISWLGSKLLPVLLVLPFAPQASCGKQPPAILSFLIGTLSALLSWGLGAWVAWQLWPEKGEDAFWRVFWVWLVFKFISSLIFWGAALKDSSR